MKITDEQESYRLLWLTNWQQLLNYKKWEEYCVRLGIARLPTDESEQLEKGHIVFLEGQEQRYIKLDEMAMSLDGSTPTAGQKATTPTFGELPDAGTSIFKSSKKINLLLEIAGNNMLPPYVIFPS